jgi:uncharacterized protein involved in type VI secretion and phage assembly
MSEALLERLADVGPETFAEGFAIAPGVVKNNIDLIGEGRVQVRITALPAFEPWARLPAIGAGSGRGFVWVPQVDDEVLVAFAQNDERSAYVLGGLWSTKDHPPLTLPNDFLSKRVLKTGLAGGLGHEVEFDDALQSITVTSSTKQKVTIDPFQIELKNAAGTLSIKMDNASQAISIQATAKLELKAAQIVIQGVQVQLKGTTIDVQAGGPCTVQGLPVKIN